MSSKQYLSGDLFYYTNGSHAFCVEFCVVKLSSFGLITHKYRGSFVAFFLVNKSVEPNKELKVEQRLPQVLSTTDTTLGMLDVRFT